RHHDLAGVFLVVQGIEQPRHHARGVAEGRMRGHVLHPLAVDVDGAIVAQRIEIFGSGLRGRLAPLGGLSSRFLDGRLRVALGHGSPPPLPTFPRALRILFGYRTSVRYAFAGRTIRVAARLSKGETSRPSAG